VNGKSKLNNQKDDDGFESKSKKWKNEKNLIP
jgi:hypothetical protein